MTHTNFGDVPNLCSPPHDNCLIGVSASNVILQRARFVLNSRIGGGLFEDKFPAAPPRLVVQPGGGGPGTAASTTAPSQQPVKGLQIVSPTSVDSFGAGSAIPVVIRSINGFTADWVLVGIDGDLQVATFDGLTSTWRATVVCDLETIGALKVSAFGTTSSDRILTCDPVTIQTTIPSFVSVTSLTIDPDPVELYPSRPSVELNVVAHGSDGIDRKILSSATGISFTSTNSAIATVDGTGKVRSVALGSTSVTAFFASRSDGVAVNVYGLQGDHDNDQDVDLADFGAFAACFSGPKNSLGFQAPGIDCLIAFDYDEDGDVDLDDYARFLQVYTGPVGQDCNGNSRDDMLDILNGVASDCNHDGIPDACGQRDCNGNGIADSCDVTPQHFGFDEAQTFVSNLQADFVAVGDIDGDGLRDVLVSARTSNGVEALLNTGGGVLVPGVSTAGSINGLATAMAAGDLDNDGRTDVVVANDANSVSIFRQADFNGMFTIMTVVTLGTSASGVVPNALVLEDFDRDGDLDIAVLKGSTTGGKVEFIRNNNNGTFTRLANSNNARAGASSMAAADVDMDGKVDLAVANSVDNSVLVLRNTSTTSITFANASVPNTYAQVGWFANPVAIAAGDVTGDGKPDFLVCNRANGDASLMVNSGTGFFTITTAYTLGITPTAARGADLDGNGAIDFAIANDTMTAISALQSAPEACRMTVSAFSAAQSFAVEAGGALDLALGDLDGNGTIDVVSANGPSRTVSVLLNHTILPASHDRDGNGRPDECDDCNGNGKLDSCDIASGLVTDCNGNGIPDGCEIAAFDCDHNGIHDACEIANHSVPDCNGNGIPDSCDIASGTSTDCNGNGIPDECDIASGNFPDCNQNGVLDACEPDCNGNGIPDDCDLHFVYGATSPQLSPIGWDNGAEFFQLHTFAATPAASGNVTLRFFAKGDFSASDEYVSVYLNNGFVGNVFVSGASDCPGTPNQATITLSRDEYNVRRGPSGNMTVLMRPTTAVWTGVCGPQGGTFIQVQLDYPAATSVDLNGNGIPDECEH
ncbi:MAG: VCBS repeat-containing protein [Planctomycetes bacterium]|nr:VCBS repeat-containing protein [Planctomycetota bacterium]